MRQILLDTETTGLEPSDGHRIIEIGCVELINRRLTGQHYHQYLNPERDVDAGAQEVHGLSAEFLSDKPLFADVVDDFLDFIRDAEVIIHNAPFDIGFINSELQRFDPASIPIDSICEVLDTLSMARELHPGQRNSLDALCRRYDVDNSQRELHGALLDAEILADVYLAMTGGQADLLFDPDEKQTGHGKAGNRQLSSDRPKLRVILPTTEELVAHKERLAAIEKASNGLCLWKSELEG